MTNPVLARSAAFGARPVQPQAPQYPTYQAWDPATQTYTQPGAPGQTYGQPYNPYNNPPAAGFQQPYGQIPYQTPPMPPQTGYQDTQKVMTLDDVLTKSLLTIGTTVVVAVLSVWVTIAFNLPIGTLAGAGMICGLATIIFAFVAAARRRVGPGVAIGFAALEGIFLGAISLIFEMYYHGIVLQAVLATFVAAGLTLAAFHFGKVRLSTKMLKIVMISMVAYVGVALVNLVLYLFGFNLGLFPAPGQPVSLWAWLAALIGVVLAVYSLLSDFQYVEQGIANRAPAAESWRAAYGLTVTLVWLYVNLLRILSYIRR